MNEQQKLGEELIKQQMQASLHYSRMIGNCYTGALYLGIISLLENTEADLSHQRIGLYSYGSGCVGEFFSGIIQTDYQKILNTEFHHHLLTKRRELTIQEYETFYNFRYPTDGSHFITPKHSNNAFRLAGIDRHKPIYEMVY